jgi:hypothetical protein
MKFDLILQGKNEFYPKLNNKTYNILKVDNDKKEEFMNTIFDDFKRGYIGIDFEFNKVTKGDRDIALLQLNLENDSDTAYIFILYPPALKEQNKLIELLTNPKLIKILHGAESLDIPYLFNQLLITKENIDKFCTNFFDTKFLCDYKNISDKLDNKCSIYNLLLDNKIITQDKVDELNKIEETMGPIYLVHIDIYKLSSDVLRYSLYDVIFLPELLKKFINLEIYKDVIPEISCLVNKYKRNIEIEFNELEQIINSMNMYFIDDKILLKDIWEYYFFTTNSEIINLSQINYFKKFIEIITKFAVYFNISKNYTIYKNNKQKIGWLKLDKYFIWLSKYSHFNKIFNEYNKLIKNSMLN